MAALTVSNSDAEFRLQKSVQRADLSRNAIGNGRSHKAKPTNRGRPEGRAAGDSMCEGDSPSRSTATTRSVHSVSGLRFEPLTPDCLRAALRAPAGGARRPLAAAHAIAAFPRLPFRYSSPSAAPSTADSSAASASPGGDTPRFVTRRPMTPSRPGLPEGQPAGKRTFGMTSRTHRSS